MSSHKQHGLNSPGEPEKKARWWKYMQIAIPILLLFLYTFLYWSIPDEIRLLSGQNTSLSYAWYCSLEIKETQAIQVASSDVSPNPQIYLTGRSEERAGTEAVVSLFGVLPLKKVRVEIWPQMDLIPMGTAVGIDIRTDGILVLGLGEVTEADGTHKSPAKGVLYSGDRIYKIDGERIRGKQEMMERIAACQGRSLLLDIERGGNEMQVTVQPVRGADGSYKIGLWIRDRAQGIGTLTYVDPESGQFGAVGHGMMDVDLKELLPVGEGTICRAVISRVKKGDVGEPGEIVASLSRNTLGNVEKNTECGLFGTYTGECSTASIPVAFRDQVSDGDVKILCTLEGMEPRWYDARIQRVSMIASQNIGFTVEITDPALVEKTGGIIQGMSGSPIMQNGCLIGAVTHVLVQDPGKGYGIYIEDMLSQHLDNKAA